MIFYYYCLCRDYLELSGDLLTYRGHSFSALRTVKFALGNAVLHNLNRNTLWQLV